MQFFSAPFRSPAVQMVIWKCKEPNTIFLCFLLGRPSKLGLCDLQLRSCKWLFQWWFLITFIKNYKEHANVWEYCYNKKCMFWHFSSWNNCIGEWHWKYHQYFSEPFSCTYCRFTTTCFILCILFLQITSCRIYQSSFSMALFILKPKNRNKLLFFKNN